MNMHRKALIIRIALRCLLLFPLALLPQMPPQPARLVIKSIPTGAKITINGRAMNPRTDITFVVSPGIYKVSVSGDAGKPNCAEKTVQVYSGQTATLICSSTAWAVQ